MYSDAGGAIKGSHGLSDPKVIQKNRRSRLVLVLILVVVIISAVPKQRKQLVHVKAQVLDLLPTQRRLRQLALLLLQLSRPISLTSPTDAHKTYRQYPILNRVVDLELIDVHRALLAEAVRAVERLVLERRVPPHVDEDDVVAGGEVEARAARLERDEDDLDALVLADLLERVLAHVRAHLAVVCVRL